MLKLRRLAMPYYLMFDLVVVAVTILTGVLVERMLGDGRDERL
jgi:predicted alpha/beta hydrolase